jgi:hypothetical protein
MVSDLLRSLVGRQGFVGFFVTKGGGSDNPENRVTYYVDVPQWVEFENIFWDGWDGTKFF